MRQEELSAVIIKRLDQFYPNPTIPLDHSNEFTLLIAVMLSAQSTDKKVNEVTKDLFCKYDSPEKMCRLSQIKIYEYIKQLGLAKQKAKYALELSKMIVKKYSGNVPRDIEELKLLPGVGHKTASVVISQAFKIPAFPVDTHIHRLAQRWKITSGKSVTQTEKDMKKLFPINIWNKLHLQIIYYGREYCTARSCYGLECPICTELYPKRRQPIKTLKA
ncbi:MULTISPECIES: endonuclease III [Prochlorococcus]|uniref:endonuclease III n=1 Tax=Prochlorococcus TaxID=1218 RepID=UPI0005339685|nr:MULTISPECIES: endonuclease III [Prochlorococcus]KGG12388.1 Endonuclease III [Prochlorococcus sp. MIT 0601]